MAEAVMDSSERPGGPRSRKGMRTRARLVDAAKQIFEEQGFLDARVSDIAERAGLSHGSFYHYFESKDEVFLEVADAQQERVSGGTLGDRLLLSTYPELETGELMRRYCRNYLEHYQADARLMGVIEQVTRTHEEFRRTRAGHQERYIEQAIEGLELLQAAGRADRSLDARVVGPALTGMVTRFAEMWLVEKTVDCSLDEAVDNLATLLLNALGVARLAPAGTSD